jgi:hypothetical protein
LYLEYENFNGAQQNEETFVPFLNFPVGKNFTYQEKKIMSETYERVTIYDLSLFLKKKLYLS